MNQIVAENYNIIHLAENPAKLLQAWQQLQAQHPGPMPLRARDAAQELGVTESQLVASRCGQGVIRMTGDWREIIKELPTLGKVMSLVRNEHIVHEAQGEYGHISFGHGGKIGIVENHSIDLRIFLYNWSVAFAVTDIATNGKERISLQFFDKFGTSIQKIYLLEESNHDAFTVLVEKYRDANQSTHQDIAIPEKAKPSQPDTQIDIEAFRLAWADLKDIHAYYPMLKKFNVARQQSLRLAGLQWAEPIATTSMRTILEACSETGVPLMFFVMNGSILQIYTGPIHKVKPIHGWLNVLDGDFNLHLVEDSIKTAWLVRKPTVDGILTVLEFFDKDEELIVTLFGKNAPGIPEDLNWRELAEGLVHK